MIKFLLLAAVFCLSRGGVLAQGYGSPMNIISDMMTGGYVKPDGTTTVKPPVIDVRGAYGSGGSSGGDGNDSSYKPTITSTTPSAGGSSNAAINCREFVLTIANDVDTCGKVKQSNLNAGLDSTTTPVGYCRWDSTAKACWCPRPKILCDDIKQCYWNKDPSLTGNPFAIKGQIMPSSGECISNAERFYNILSNLLLKRGKKDFAIRINYSSAPARGQLPLGPYGPAIIGAGSSIQGMLPPPYMTPTQGYGDPNAGYGLPTQMYPGYGYPTPSYGMMPAYPQMGGYQYS